MADKPRIIHGNKAKATGDTVPAYLANTVTMADKKRHETPVVEDQNVAYAKKFVQENKK